MNAKKRQGNQYVTCCRIFKTATNIYTVKLSWYIRRDISDDIYTIYHSLKNFTASCILIAKRTILYQSPATQFDKEEVRCINISFNQQNYFSSGFDYIISYS
jgi:hypothetical protein